MDTWKAMIELDICDYLLNDQYMDIMLAMAHLCDIINYDNFTEEDLVEAWKTVQAEYKKKEFISVEVDDSTVQTLDRLQFQVKVAIEILNDRNS